MTINAPAAAAPAAPLPSSRKQVFIAYPYRLYPPDDYRPALKALEDKYDVTFIFADEKITNMHMMKKIETFIRGSDFAIYDISGWNPNVTLELGFGMAVGDQWYIAVDPSKTEANEVPSDLRGLDRIQYKSFAELATKVGVLIEQRYPKRPRVSIDAYFEDRRGEIRALLAKSPGLSVSTLAEVLGVDVPVAQLVLRPMVEAKELETSGVKKGMKYYLQGKVPPA